MKGKPGPQGPIAFFCLIWISSLSLLQAQDRDIRRAEGYLKKHLRSLEKEYDLPKWDKRLQRAHQTHAKLAEQAEDKKSLSPSFHSKLKNFETEISQLGSSSLAFNTYLNQLNISNLGSRVDADFKRDGRSFPLEKRLEFQHKIRPGTLDKMKDVRFFQMRFATLQTDFTRLKAEWMFAYSVDFLSKHVQSLLNSHRFHESEALFDDLSLQLSYWSQASTGDASQAQKRIEELYRTYEARKSAVLGSLHNLLEVLHTDMLFSDLLARASEDGVEFTLSVEERIESSLKAQAVAHLMPIRQRIDGWRRLEDNMRDGLAQVARMRESQREQLVAEEQLRRMEEARMTALRAEQERVERERKQRLESALSALSSFDLKAGSDIQLDQDAQVALNRKNPQRLTSTTHVGSAQKQLHVPKQAFSDSLTQVEKFVVEESRMNLSNLTLDERSAHSLYVYTSPEGRTTPKDLNQFVQDIALTSFGADPNFITYRTPAEWSPGTRIRWSPDRHDPKAVKDREFSFVGLVVDAHRKRSDNSKDAHVANTVNLTPNMLIIFGPQGQVIRYQTFSDINSLVISRGDLREGKLHYKFLNYSADRSRIYLNGIDHEVKVSHPNGKS